MFNFFRKLKLLIDLINKIEVSKEGIITIDQSLNISINGDLMIGTTGHHIEYSENGCKVMLHRKMFSGSSEDRPIKKTDFVENIVNKSVEEVNQYYRENLLPYRINSITYKTETIDRLFSIDLSCNIEQK